MADFENPSPEKIAAWDAWLAGRPEKVRAVAERFKPWKLYRIASGHRVTIYSFSEDGTMTVVVSARWNLVGFERRVFGIRPEELVECELPAADEPVGDGGVTLEDLQLPEAERARVIQEKADAWWRKKGEQG